MIAIDPNFDKKSGGNGCAYFHERILHTTFFQRPKFPVRFLDVAHDCVVIEKPQFKEKQSAGVDANVILELGWQGALLAGMYAGACGCRVLERTVTDWKGSQHKPVQHGALWEILDPTERRALGGARTETLIMEAIKRGAGRRWRPTRGRTNGWYPAHCSIPDLLDAAALGCVELGRLRGA